MNTTRSQRIAGFVSEYCPLCGSGHLNRISREFVKCSLCETEFTVVGDTLEEVNGTDNNAEQWSKVNREIDAVVDQLLREEKETLMWELVEE
jgi:ribosomal protein L37AE/L43A